MKLYIKKIEGLNEENLPKQANPLDAGYDIIATTEPKIVAEKDDIINPNGILDDNPPLYRRITYIEYGTNLYCTPEVEVKKQVSNACIDASGALCDLIFEENRIIYHLELFARSSISKYNLVLANGVGTIDNKYTGQILVRFKYIWQPQDFKPFRNDNGYEMVGAPNHKYIYQKHDKIAQIKARPNVDIDFEFVDELPASERSENGFGSSGN